MATTHDTPELKKLQKIIRQHPERVPIHFRISRKLALKEPLPTPGVSGVGDGTTQGDHLIKALAPREMQYHELLHFIRNRYLDLRSHEAIFCLVNGVMVPQHSNLGQIWFEQGGEVYKKSSLVITVVKENTFGAR